MVDGNRKELAMTSAGYLTTMEVAELCRTSPDTVRFWRYSGQGPRSFKVGRRVLYRRVDVEQWLDELHDREGVQ
jgi:predicted DNA-binding transcriptional regulator AlpA